MLNLIFKADAFAFQ